MTAYFADRIITEFYNGSSWVNISAYVVGDMSGDGGLGGWRPENRVAVLGTLRLTLNNKAKLFSPMGGDVVRSLNTLSGFNKGSKIRVRVEIGSGIHLRTWTIWTGRISSIDSDDKNWGNEQTRITAVDWMQIPAQFPMKRANIALNKTMDAALTLLLARLSVQPEATDFDAGTQTFKTVFDNVRTKSMGIGEFNKLALSELGYIYLKPDGTLRAENGNARSGARALSTIELNPADYSFLLCEDGTFMLTEAGDLIILDDNQAAALATDAESFNITVDANAVINSATIQAYPVVTDLTRKVLYSLGVPFWLPSGNSIAFTAHYTDPNGNGQISGTGFLNPVATTDYLMNDLIDGTGSDLTANLTVSATYYGDSVDYVLTNVGADGAWVTFLQARGYGIYYGNSVSAQADDTASQTAYGLQALNFDQRYQRDTYLGQSYASAIIGEYKTPKSRVTKMSYLANLNKNHFMAFLSLTVGMMFMLTEDRSGISNYYTITDRAFTVKQGGIISVAYGVRPWDSYLSGNLNPVTVEFGINPTDALNYGYLPRVSNLTQRTYSAWVWLDTNPGANYYAVMNVFSDSGGMNLRIDAGPIITLYAKGRTGPGIWQSAAGVISLGAWHHIVATRDNTYPAAPAKIYLDGTLLATTETNPQVGSIADETGALVVIGNVKTATLFYSQPFDGKIFDARIYNRILTQAEVTTLYNSGTASSLLVLDGLVFQGPAVSADIGTAASLAGTALNPNNFSLLENAFHAVATQAGSPVIRANP